MHAPSKRLKNLMQTTNKQQIVLHKTNNACDECTTIKHHERKHLC